MSVTSFNGSFAASTIHDASLLLTSVALNNALVDSDVEYFSNEPRVFVVVEKPFGYVLGEQLRNFAEFIYSKLPSFSFPTAAASSIECIDEVCVKTTEPLSSPCEMPGGSYAGSCHDRTITYDQEEEECRFRAWCSTIIPSIPPVQNEITFKPNDALILGNKNGTLTIQEGSKISYISLEEVNLKLNRNFNALKVIEQQLNVPGIDEASRNDLERDKEKLAKKQAEIIGKLMPGSVVTFDANQQPLVITSENKKEHIGFYSSDTFNSFQNLAEFTGGLLGLSRSPEHIPYIFEKLFQHILYSIEPDVGVDIAFVLDTTGSMSDDIEVVKSNLLAMIERLKLDGTKVRIGLLEYRDSMDRFLNRVVIDFTTDLDEVGKAIQKITTEGGDDFPEAVFDALLATKDQFSWDQNQNMKHVAILIGDAPPHSKTIDKLHGQAEVIQEYQTKGITIAIYPIVANK